MSRLARFISIAIIGLGMAALVMGVAFVVEGQSKANFIKSSMRQENVSLADLGVQGADPNNLIDSAGEAQKAADTIAEHRRTYLAPTYKDLLGGKQFDPDNATQVKYMQALNLENYLYLGVASLGLTTVTIVSGIFMIVTGVALSLTGFVLGRLPGKVPPTA